MQLCFRCPERLDFSPPLAHVAHGDVLPAQQALPPAATSRAPCGSAGCLNTSIDFDSPTFYHMHGILDPNIGKTQKQHMEKRSAGSCTGHQGSAAQRHWCSRAEHAPHSAARALLSQTPAMLVDLPVIRLGLCISPCPSPGREWPGRCTSPVKCPHTPWAEPPSHNPQFSNPASRIFDPECQMALQSKQGRPAVKGHTSSCGRRCHPLQPASQWLVAPWALPVGECAVAESGAPAWGRLRGNPAAQCGHAASSTVTLACWAVRQHTSVQPHSGAPRHHVPPSDPSARPPSPPFHPTCLPQVTRPRRSHSPARRCLVLLKGYGSEPGLKYTRA